MHTMTTQDLADEFARRFNNHDVEGLAELHDPEYVSHDNGAVGDLDVFKATLDAFFAGVPDARIDVINAAFDGDLYTVNFITSGTNTEPLFGSPATGKRLEFNEIRVRRVADGRIAEEWGLLDAGTMQAQLAG